MNESMNETSWSSCLATKKNRKEEEINRKQEAKTQCVLLAVCSQSNRLDRMAGQPIIRPQSSSSLLAPNKPGHISASVFVVVDVDEKKLICNSTVILIEHNNNNNGNANANWLAQSAASATTKLNCNGQCKSAYREIENSNRIELIQSPESERC